MDLLKFSKDGIFWKFKLQLRSLHINKFRNKKLGVLTWILLVHFQQCVLQQRKSRKFTEIISYEDKQIIAVAQIKV